MRREERREEREFGARKETMKIIQSERSKRSVNHTELFLYISVKSLTKACP